MLSVKLMLEIQEYMIDCISDFVSNQSTPLSIDVDKPVIMKAFITHEYLKWGMFLQGVISLGLISLQYKYFLELD